MFSEKKSLLFKSSFISQTALFTYRFFALLYISGFLVWGTYASGSLFHNFRYLTFWGIYAAVSYLILVNILTLKYIWRRRYNKGDLIQCNHGFKFASKMSCIMFEVAFSIQPPIVLLFWTVGLADKLERLKTDSEFLARTLNAHGGIFLCLLGDFIFSRIPFVLTHFSVVLSFLLTYLVNNYIHTIYGVKPVYKVLDWKDFKSALLILGAVFLFFLNHMFLVFIYTRKSTNLKRPKAMIEEDEKLEYLAESDPSKDSQMEFSHVSGKE